MVMNESKRVRAKWGMMRWRDIPLVASLGVGPEDKGGVRIGMENDGVGKTGVVHRPM